MSKKLKAKELVGKVAARSGMTHSQVDQVLKATGEVVADELEAGTGLTLPGIGSLSTRYREPRRQQTFGRMIDVPGRNVPIISWAGALKDRLAKSAG